MKRLINLLIALPCAAICCFGQCPTALDTMFYTSARWPSSSSPTYDFMQAASNGQYTTVSIPSFGIANDIHQGFAAWTTANNSQNSSNVSFVYSAGSGYGSQFRVYAQKVNYPGDFVNNLDPGRFGFTTYAMYQGTGIIFGATLTLNFDGIIPGQTYPFFSTAISGYHDAVKKATMHEAGHTMWLKDQNMPYPTGACAGQTAGQSVMNSMCGTNDSSGNMPSAISSCDNAAIYW